MITLNPSNGIAQIASIYEAVELSWEEKSMLTCFFARLYASKGLMPIPTLAITLRLPVPKVLALALTLRRHGYVKIQTQDDGQHAVLNVNHAIFDMKSDSKLAHILKTAGKLPTSNNLLSYWRAAFFKAFKRYPPNDPKDLIRMRWIIRKQGEESMQAVNDYLLRYRNMPSKCSTLGLFLSYGQGPKV